MIAERPLVEWRLPNDPEKIALWCTFASFIAVIFSIAIFHIFLGAALLAMVAGRIRPRFPRITLPLALFAAGTLIAFAFSEVPSAGLSQLKHMYLYLALPVVFTMLRTPARAALYLMAVVAATALMAALGCAEFVQKMHAAHVAGKSFYEFYLEARISGLQRHWMEFSGQELYGFLIASAWLFFAPLPKRWNPRAAVAAGVACATFIAMALLLSYTRSIWIAAFFGIVYLLWFWRRKLVLLAPAIVIIGLLAAPASIKERVDSIVHPHGDTDSNSHRLVCWYTGFAMIKAHPLLGLGPDVQKLKFYDYVPPGIPWPLPTGSYGHLHNVYIQYAADRGIPTMLMLVWFLVRIISSAWRKLKTLPPGRGVARFTLQAAIACTIGSMISGIFEYNLNTSVVLSLFLAIAACASIAIERADESSLQGREILLAGGAGGLGVVTASLLQQEGASVILSYRANRERAERVAPGHRLLRADLSSEHDRAALLDAAPELYGLVILSGDPSRGSNLAETLPRSFETNFAGPILLAREAADRMKACGTAGAIVLIGSMQAGALFPQSTAYAAQKAALVHAARILAAEMRGPANIRVNVVSPGVTTAGMAQASVASGKYEKYLHSGAIPRYGKAEDIARAIRFFLEPDNYITGQVLTVDGGLTL